ncbi:beta-galactosidase family protein [Pengzhenrongella sp.]|jgi:beta-galactosidase|uniref:glycoside hydrolase family 35 protein n=1 Tax=Pengzhenrongella sp. TaxID=2888820 RepID=UPI002F9258DC
MSSFEIGERDFLLDGEPFQIISGALHYFRIHPDLWADRLHKARLMGLNTVETYVAWNFHAPTADRFDTDGPRDLGRFLDLVAAEGLHALVRPGPYICAEWDNGGLPAWLFADPSVGIRRDEPLFIPAITRYFDHLLPLLKPRQVTGGGCVLAVQIENEYGAYGCDQDYLRTLVELTRAGGITVPLFTCDQPTDAMLSQGGLPELHKTATFGSRSLERLATLRAHQPTGPLMCAEYWNGWFDSWGGHHHTTTPAETAADLDDLLASGASVNLYMFHGGTNFGFTNGANDKGTYAPITTSYDYDAPLSESGEPTAKYFAMREVIARHAPVPDDVPAPAAPAPALTVDLTRRRSLWAAIDQLGAADWTRRTHLPSTDDVGQYSGFTLYRTHVRPDDGVVTFAQVRDRALVYLDGAPVGVLDRSQGDTAIALPPGRGGTLDLLVEDQGRVDYGPRLGEPKGLIGPARTAVRELTDWQLLPLDLDLLHTAVRAADPVPPDRPAAGPVLLHGTFATTPGADHFLSTAGWGKGVVWVNGFNLGRFWSAGPTRTMYVPGPLLTTSGNEIVVLELHGRALARASFVSGPELGHTEF